MTKAKRNPVAFITGVTGQDGAHLAADVTGRFAYGFAALLHALASLATNLGHGGTITRELHLRHPLGVSSARSRRSDRASGTKSPRKTTHIRVARAKTGG